MSDGSKGEDILGCFPADQHEETWLTPGKDGAPPRALSPRRAAPP